MADTKDNDGAKKIFRGNVLFESEVKKDYKIQTEYAGKDYFKTFMNFLEKSGGLAKSSSYKIYKKMNF